MKFSKPSCYIQFKQFETQLFEMLLRKYNVLCYTEAKLRNTKLHKKPVSPLTNLNGISNHLKKKFKKNQFHFKQFYKQYTDIYSKSTLFIQSV